MFESIIAIYLFNANVDFEKAFNDCEQAGINTIITNPFVYETDEWAEAVTDSNLQFIYNFPIFCETAYLAENPGNHSVTNQGNPAIGADWLQFACPSNLEFVESQKERLRQTLKQYDPEVMCLDFIRYFVFWEMVYPGQKSENIEHGCWCEKCFSDFEQFAMKDIHKNQNWIRENAFDEWTAWKCETIRRVAADFTEIIRDHNQHIKIGVKTVPWRKSDFDGAMEHIAGQDLELLAPYFDFFIPMTYSHMVKQNPEWIHQVLDDSADVTTKPVYACLQLEKCYLDEELSMQEFSQTLDSALASPSQGLFIFHYDEIFSNPEKMELIRSRFQTKRGEFLK